MIDSIIMSTEKPFTGTAAAASLIGEGESNPPIPHSRHRTIIGSVSHRVHLLIVESRDLNWHEERAMTIILFRCFAPPCKKQKVVEKLLE